LPKRSRKSTELRPTQGIVQKSLLDILRPKLPGVNFLDLFAGTGQIGFSALEFGARKAVLVENSTRQLKILRETLEKKGWQTKAEIYPQAVETMLGKLKENFDLIFIDPPYDLSLGFPTLKAVIQNRLLADDGWVIVEHRKNDLLPEQVDNLSKFREKIFGQTVLSFYRQEENAAIGNQRENNLEEPL